MVIAEARALTARKQEHSNVSLGHLVQTALTPFCHSSRVL